MRLACLLLLPIALVAEPAKLAEPYQTIVGLAHAAPPEFAADALLRVEESGKIADRDARRELIEEAFRLAGAAKFPLRMRGIQGSLVDTRSGYLSLAYDLKLDALSLEGRAVRDMLALDAAKARELFQQIPRPALQPLTCDDALVYQVPEFYETLALIANGAFTAKEREKEEHVHFLLDYIGVATSPAQLAPLARVIKTASVTPQQREILWTKFNGLLENIQPDGRSFAASLPDIAREITPASRPSFEKYTQKSEGCTGDAVAVSAANLAPKTPLTPKLDRYWDSGVSQVMLDAAKQLRFAADGRPLSDADRSSREWQIQLTDFLSRLASWGPDQEKSEADYYHERSIVYEALVELIPPGPQRDTAMQAYLDFMSNSSLQQSSPVEWFAHARAMLERVRETTTGEPGKLLDEFKNSGNPILALYAALEKTFAGPLPAWVKPSQ